MLLEYSPSRKHIRNQLSAQCNLHQEARYSVIWLDREDARDFYFDARSSGPHGQLEKNVLWCVIFLPW
jgi:hypothetical protein